MRTRIDALIGAIAGDIIGSPYEFYGVAKTSSVKMSHRSHFTDDTVLTIAVADWLSSQDVSLQDTLVRYARKYYWVGYGGMFLKWCRKSKPKPYNSYGNGSAMRVSAVGCWANTIEEAMQMAKESALPTHNHPEGIKGAQAIAVAIFLARQGLSKKDIKAKLMELFDYELNRSYDDILKEGYGFHVTCQKTIPFALVCFFDSVGYEDCIVKAMMTNMDTDTAAAVAGAVAGAFYSIPENIKEEALSHLPQEMKTLIENFENKLSQRENMMKKRIFIDMDNVLVDFQSAINLQSEETLKQYAGRFDEIPGLFGLMTPMPGAIEAVHELEKHYDLFILSTAPWNNPSAWSDKVKWVTKYLDDVFHKRMVITHRKDLCQGDYLIDDRGKNGTSEFAGEWIEFGSEKFPDWQSVLEYLLPSSNIKP